MERLSASPVIGTGWVAVRIEEPGAAEYYVRCRDDGRGGVEIAGLLVSVPDGRVTAAKLREVPIGRIEATINASGLLELINGAGEASDDPVLSWLNRSPIEYTAPLAPAGAGETSGPLARPDGKEPAAFSALVAARYRDLVRTSAKPAVLMAEEAGVPVATARRWINEARRRGLLPAGRQGRAQ